MIKMTVKMTVTLLGIGSAAALGGGASAHSVQTQARGGWVCNAYGHGGEKHVSRTVTGEREATRGAAQASAMRECYKKLSTCQPSGCWPGE